MNMKYLNFRYFALNTCTKEGNISSCLQKNMCTVREYKCGGTFLVVTVIFAFRDRKEEGVMSNRAEQMSDRAESDSIGREDSAARLDSPSDWRSRKVNTVKTKECSSKFVISLTGTHNCLHGGHIFLLSRGLFNHAILNG